MEKIIDAPFGACRIVIEDGAIVRLDFQTETAIKDNGGRTDGAAVRAVDGAIEDGKPKCGFDGTTDRFGEEFVPAQSEQNRDDRDKALLARAESEIQEYFAGARKEFDLPLRLSGTPFQKKVWRALCDVPYGETRSYAQIAAAIGQPNAMRAVGGANHRNPVSIIVPCHRVIGADGSLTGYGGGLPAKEFLLELERGFKTQA